jgi:hypothetical protein
MQLGKHFPANDLGRRRDGWIGFGLMIRRPVLPAPCLDRQGGQAKEEIKYRERLMWDDMGGWWPLSGIFLKANIL